VLLTTYNLYNPYQEFITALRHCFKFHLFAQITLCPRCKGAIKWPSVQGKQWWIRWRRKLSNVHLWESNIPPHRTTNIVQARYAQAAETLRFEWIFVYYLDLPLFIACLKQQNYSNLKWVNKPLVCWASKLQRQYTPSLPLIDVYLCSFGGSVLCTM
jgi:hypothetical protein